MSLDLSKIEYIDTHSHLQFSSYDANREEVINRMKEAKIATMCIGTDLKESRLGRELSLKNENILYSVALHPHDNLSEFEYALHNKEIYFKDLKDIADNEKCVAIGECGLDYFYIYKNYSEGKINKEELEVNIAQQKDIFRSHIELALELDLPLMLHIRPSEVDGNKEDAYIDALEILEEYKSEKLKANFHFFVSTKKLLEKILENKNYTVSIPAVCTFTSEYDEMIRAIPFSRMHIETDSPFVLPKNRRREAKQNEPSYVVDVFEKVCEIKEIHEKGWFKNILKENFSNFYLK